MRTLNHSMGNYNLWTIHMLSSDHSAAFGSGSFEKLIKRHQQKAALFLEEGQASRSH